ncbi:MAG: hypothetical protein R2838_09215 [Caldilineaceae bacterium]
MGSVVPAVDIPNAGDPFCGRAGGAFILGKTILGRYTVAIGSNEEATRSRASTWPTGRAV